jgi:HAD-hyrolase-like
MAISADLGVRKPYPAIFLHALTALNVKPEHAVMVGDSLAADMVGGLNLGIFSAWKPKAKVRAQIPAHLLTLARSATERTVSIHSGSPATVVRPDFVPGSLDPSTDAAAPVPPPPGTYATDDDIMLARAQNRDEYLERFIRGEIRPDLVIERLSDLPDAFTEAGVQP